jgi:glycosyltransferase involved in cell wall biosynthesis
MHQSRSRSNTDISLIICTRDRCQKLTRCLESVRHITFERPWELIIVDNGSTDDTAAIIQEFIRSTSIRAVHLFEPKPGKSTGLNTALRVAQGELVAFTDDDCYPAPDFLIHVWAAFADPSIGYITGRIQLHDPADHRMTINESMTPRTIPGRSFVYTGAVHGANMTFRRKVLLDIGGFDPLFGPGALLEAAEDLEVASRASAMGWKGQYRPEVIISHHHERNASDAPRLWKSYDIGRGAYHVKLLLSGHEFLWFARSMYQLRWRYRFTRTTVLWELVGAAKYGYLYVTQTLRGWLGQS